MSQEKGFVIPPALRRVVYDATKPEVVPAIAYPFRVYAKDAAGHAFYVSVQSVVDWRDLKVAVKGLGLTPVHAEKREKNGSYAKDAKATESMIPEVQAQAAASGLSEAEKLALKSFLTGSRALVLNSEFTDATRAEFLEMTVGVWIVMGGDPATFSEAASAALAQVAPDAQPVQPSLAAAASK